MRRTERRGAGWERAAAEYLRDKGAEILAMNYACPGGEIDIIAQMDGRTVFVEVKQRFSTRYGTASQAVDFGKRDRIRRCARAYLHERGQDDAPARFDVVEITDEGVRHIQNAFS